MTDKQPEALRLADALDYYDKYDISVTGTGIDAQAAALLRTQHAELMQLRAEVAALSANALDDCRHIERKDALLRQALKNLEGCRVAIDGSFGTGRELEQIDADGDQWTVVIDIRQELSQ